MRRVNDHRIIAAFTAVVGFGFIVSSEAFDFWQIRWLQSAALSVGTALVALSFIELIFQIFLKQELLSDAVNQFQKAINKPVSWMYLQREDMPPDQNPINIVRNAKSSVYVKAISFGGLGRQGFLEQVEEIFEERAGLRLRIALLSPDFPGIKQVMSLNGIKVDTIISSIDYISEKVSEMREKNYDIDIKLIDSYPTSGYWLIDHNTDNAMLKIEPYLYHGENKSDRINLIFQRKDGIRFFNKFVKSVLREWGEEQPRNAD